jgi:hypothetical protein
VEKQRIFLTYRYAFSMGKEEGPVLGSLNISKKALKRMPIAAKA